MKEEGGLDQEGSLDIPEFPEVLKIHFSSPTLIH